MPRGEKNNMTAVSAFSIRLQCADNQISRSLAIFLHKSFKIGSAVLLITGDDGAPVMNEKSDKEIIRNSQKKKSIVPRMVSWLSLPVSSFMVKRTN